MGDKRTEQELFDTVMGALAENKVTEGKYNIEVTDKGVTVTLPTTVLDTKYFEYSYNTNKKEATIIAIKEPYREVGYDSGGTAYTIGMKDERGKTITDIVLPSEVIGPDGEEYTITSMSNIFRCDTHTNGDVSKITSIVLPESITSITIPAGVTSIGNSTFSGCTSLTNITIPEGVTSIGSSAFYGCSSLTDVYYTGTEAEWNSITISGYNTTLTNATKHYEYVVTE